MQIQAITCHKPHASFMGYKPKKAQEEPREMSNEEVLKNAKKNLAKRPPVFTPKQKAIMPEIELFKADGVIETMQDYLDEIDDVESWLERNGENYLETDEKKFYRTEKELSYANGYKVKIDVTDENDEPLYTYNKKVYGGYSTHSVKSEFEDYGKVELSRQGRYGAQSFFVNNLENEDYCFGGVIDEDGSQTIDYIENLR